MQLAVDVQLPSAFGGDGGAAVYIDTGAAVLHCTVLHCTGGGARCRSWNDGDGVGRGSPCTPDAGAHAALHCCALCYAAEGSFMLERCCQMADAFLAHLARLAAAKGDAGRRAAAAALTRERLLEGIHYFRVRDPIEQVGGVRGGGTFPSVACVCSCSQVAKE